MRAVHLTGHGPPESVIEIVDKDMPVPGPGEVRIEVRAAALNHKDVFARVGHPYDDLSFPKQTGTDIAGVIDEVGAEVREHEVGDPVNVYPRIYCGDCEYCKRGEQSMCTADVAIGQTGSNAKGTVPGGFAEYVVLPARVVEPLPAAQEFVTAAAWPVTYTTAWRMIVTKGDLGPAETALILGASGGVGNAALQIADAVNATTYATTSSEEKAASLEPWADEIIDYTDTDFSSAVEELTDGRGVDLVADHVGAETWQTSIDSLARGGRMVICGATSGPHPDIDIRSIYRRHRQVLGAPLGNVSDFRAAGRLIEHGVLSPLIDRVLPLEDIAHGHRLLEQREVTGKIVVRPQQ